MKRLFVIFAGILLLCAGFAKAQNGSDEYLKAVQLYADTMIEYGRDRYGPVHSPLFAATLDSEKLELFPQRPPSIKGVREEDRSTAGANPLHDENLYQVLYALSEITGNQKYAKAADDALAWFFHNSQSPTTGLLAWGEHLSWLFRQERPHPSDRHEFSRRWVLWDINFRLAPEASLRFALGLWEHQVADQRDANFSRHARYSSHGPEINADFSGSAGHYVDAWAAAYQHSKDPQFSKAIQVFVDAFDSRRNLITGTIPAFRWRPERTWPGSNLSFAIDLWASAARLPSDLVIDPWNKQQPKEITERMRMLSRRIDDAYLATKHELHDGGRGFLHAAWSHNLEPDGSGVESEEQSPFTNNWDTGYDRATHASAAMLCLLRYSQTRDDRYKKLVVATAQRYLTIDPPASTILFPGAIADVIALLVNSARITGDQRYAERANHFGRLALDKFFSGSKLPRATSEHRHYEAITRGDSLAMELIDLWAYRNNRRLRRELLWTDANP